jgi:hypothetical protein
MRDDKDKKNMNKDGTELWAVKDGVCTHYRSIVAFNEACSEVLSPGYLQSKIRLCKKKDVVSFDYNGITIHLRKPHNLPVANSEVSVKPAAKKKPQPNEHKKGQPLLRELVTHKIH